MPPLTIIEQFVTLWVVIDPIGTIPVFVAVTTGIQASKRSRVALRAALVAAGILMFFLAAGQFLIDALGISLPAFQIAGSIILFLFALTMIFGKSKPEVEMAEIDDASQQQDSLAVLPLAVPSLASPGAMLTVVLFTEPAPSPPVQHSGAGCYCGHNAVCDRHRSSAHACRRTDPQGHRSQWCSDR